MENKEKYRKRIKLYKALGAEKFQSVVFAFESLKFKVIEKLFPNLLQKIETKINKNMKRRLEEASSPEERRQIIEDAKLAILSLRKEFHSRKNINYHMNKNNPTEIIYYLNLNKKIHKNNLIFNGVLALIAIIGMSFNVSGAVALLIIEALNAVVNFECINIQNYNLCRIERIKDRLERKEARKREESSNHSAAHSLIYDKVVTEGRIPSMKEIIEGAETPEQLAQLKDLLLREVNSRGISLNEGSTVK